MSIDSQYCTNASADTLQPIPAGGLLSGDGIIGDILSPQLIEPGGPYSITYTYYDSLTRCTYSKDFNYSIHKPTTVNLIDTFILLHGSCGQLNVINNAESYRWFPTTFLDDPSIKNPITCAEENIIYHVQILDTNSCQTQDSIYIMLIPKAILSIPLSFTPNNDGINDKLLIQHVAIKKLIYYQVYDRWGKLLFETSNLKEGWDGTFKGIPQETGNYQYLIRAYDLNDALRLVQGPIILFR